ncbi:SRPBCC family protein [Paenibacillus sp. TRM 82003]|uniref:SRPBCC family protein n=1 Tax=Kineococcus sp. TRM81007 TaxID=2925831 RepID=UPI001F57CA2B|nr:SRPBCC family protein [Kineococcus sp. TRM81007]MCI2238556.1 SRPBCC family protein [Kineococcus sp. TRM81007]MCI3925086.1 SRPBCC family protein [Paenibacillus sp. TRM 82003]
MSEDPELLGGAVLRGGERATLTLTREYPHPVAAVWTALTVPEVTRRWWAALRADLRPGGEFSLMWLNGDPGELQWWPGEVTTLDAPRLLEHTNSEHGLLRWELEPVDVGALRARTRLRLTNDLEGEDAWVPMSLAAWHLHLEALGRALDGGAADWLDWGVTSNARLQRLRTAYAAALTTP